MKKRAYSLGVVICEHGLIRSVRCIVRKAQDIPTQLGDVVGEHFQPKPLLALVFKAFSPGYESVRVLMLEGVVAQLCDPEIIVQTASVQTLVRRLQRFLNKHGTAINTVLQLGVEQGTPTTTNALESKACGERSRTMVFSSLSAAMQRAKINLDDFGTTDFFSAVGLLKPQISLAYFTE